MNDIWSDLLPVLDDFAQVTDPAHYVPLPEDWCIGLSDVVNSTAAITSGEYKAVNLAGAGTITAVSNELEGVLNVCDAQGSYSLDNYARVHLLANPVDALTQSVFRTFDPPSFMRFDLCPTDPLVQFHRPVYSG